MANRCECDALATRSRNQRLDGEVDGWVGEAEPGIDAHDSGRRPCQDRHCGAVDLARAHLQGIRTDAAQAVSSLPICFGGDERDSRRARRGDAGPIGLQHLGNEILGLREAQANVIHGAAGRADQALR